MKEKKIKSTKNTAQSVETPKKDRLYKQLGEVQVEIEKVAAFLQRLNQRKVQIMQEIEKANANPKQ